MTIPTVRQHPLFPFSGNQLGKNLTQLVGILTHQHIRALLDSLHVLRVRVQRDAGHIVECSLLSHIARIGHDAPGVRRQIAELQIR